MGAHDPFDLDELAGAIGPLNSSLVIMSARSEVCKNYTGPVKKILETMHHNHLESPIAATIDTSKQRLSELETGIFNKSEKAAPATPTKVDDDESSSGFRPGR